MPLRAPSPTARAAAPTPGSPVSMEDAVWSDTATTHVTVTSRLLMGHIAIMVSAAGYGGGGMGVLGHDGRSEGREEKGIQVSSLES